VFRYPDGHEEWDGFSTEEAYGVGEVEERDGFLWTAVESRPLSAADGFDEAFDIEVLFIPEVYANLGP
jgi:hypothetical protein